MAELSFEKSLEKLEKIVSELETGDITLDDALNRYEEGIKLSRLCQEKLSQAENKIEVLSRNAKGEWVKKPFEDTEGEEFAAQSKARKAHKPAAGDEAAAEGEETLF